MSRYISDCAFCDKFGHSRLRKDKWFDVELANFGEFLLIPGIGPFREGYLMIVTRQHYHSMGQLNRKLFKDLSIFKSQVREILTTKICPPLIFEHGAGLPSGMGGGCIDHAHIHLMPLDIQLLSEIQSYVKLQLIDDLIHIETFAQKNKPYLYFEGQDGDMYVGKAEALPSQFIRRLIAKKMMIDDNWDYAVYPNYEVVRKTIDILTPWKI